MRASAMPSINTHLHVSCMNRRQWTQVVEWRLLISSLESDNSHWHVTYERVTERHLAQTLFIDSDVAQTDVDGARDDVAEEVVPHLVGQNAEFLVRHQLDTAKRSRETEFSVCGQYCVTMVLSIIFLSCCYSLLEISNYLSRCCRLQDDYLSKVATSRVIVLAFQIRKTRVSKTSRNLCVKFMLEILTYTIYVQ